MVDEHRKVIPFATTGKARHSNEAESFFNRQDNGDKWSSAGKTTVLWAQPKWIISLVCQPFSCRPPYFSPPMQKDRVSGTSSVRVRQIIDYINYANRRFPSGFRRRFRLILDYFTISFAFMTFRRLLAWLYPTHSHHTKLLRLRPHLWQKFPIECAPSQKTNDGSMWIMSHSFRTNRGEFCSAIFLFLGAKWIRPLNWTSVQMSQTGNKKAPRRKVNPLFEKLHCQKGFVVDVAVSYLRSTRFCPRNFYI